MSDRTVLLIPHKEHRKALLGPGLCNSRPSMAFRAYDGNWVPGWHGPSHLSALVLVWRGEFSSLSMTRLQDVTTRSDDVTMRRGLHMLCMREPGMYSWSNWTEFGTLAVVDV